MDTVKKVSASEKSYCRNDSGYLKTAIVGIKRIIKWGDDKIFYPDVKKNYPKMDDPHVIHGQFGIVGFSSGYTDTRVPHWHRSEVQT